jgi:hypothetical protein
MPISREQFENGLDEAGVRIQKFLAAHADQAFEPDEIAEALGENILPPKDSFGRALALLSLTWQYHSILEDLVKKGLVDKKIIQGKTWYSAHRK